MKNVPKLRFKGFSDEWKIKRLGDFIEERSEKTEDKENYPLYSLTIENGVVPKSDRYEREFLVKKEGNFKIVKQNDFVYNPMNLRFGALAVYKGESPVSVSGYYNVFYFKGEDISNFWSNYLKTDRMFYLYNTIATGSLEEKKRVHYSQFKELNLKMPQKEEQEKIANFLTKVDKFIEKQEEKVNKLEQYKKGMIQKIFSQEIRFKQDDAEIFSGWKTISLGELGVFYRGHSYNSKEVAEDGLLVLRSNNIRDNKINYEELQFVTKKCKEEIKLKNKDIIICMANGSKKLVGKTGEYRENLLYKDITVGAFCSIYRTSNRIAKYLFQTQKYQEYLSVLLAGTNINNLKNSDLEELEFKIPTSTLEQNKIANILSKIDSVVDKEKEKLEELRKWKKGLLQQMFV